MGKASKETSSSPSPLISFLSGGIAGGVEAAITYPFEFAKTRTQLRSDGKPVVSSRNPFHIITTTFRHEGLRAMYAGCTVMIVGSIAKDSVRFLSFDAIKSAFRDRETGALTPVRSLAAGMCSGVVASTFAVTPSERIKTALIDDARRGAEEKQFRSATHAIKEIYQRHGMLGLWRGYAGTTLKQAGATACRMGTYNILKEYEESQKVEQSTKVNFLNGSIAGLITTYATQPFDTVKTRSQSARGMSTLDAARSVLADHGVKGFWRGTTMRLSRTIFSGGILFTVYEKAVAVLNPVLGR